MSNKIFTIRSNNLEMAYLTAMNSFLNLSDKEMEITARIMKNSGLLDSKLRKQIRVDLQMLPKTLSQYVFFLSKKKVIVKYDDGWKLSDKVFVKDYNNQISITINVSKVSAN